MIEKKHNNTDLKRAVLNLFSTAGFDAEEMFIEPPEAMFIPKDKSRSVFFALITLLCDKSFSKVSTIGPAVLKMADLMASEHPQYCTQGVEIMPCVLIEKKVKRIFRLSISPSALNSIGSLTTNDLLVLRPCEGVTCGWYLDKEEYQ